MRANSGALRVVPGSHLRPFHEQVEQNLEGMQLEIDQVPAYVCEADPGDVVAFDVRCWHASWGGSSGRRMCTCVYYNNPQDELEAAAVRRRAAEQKNTPGQFGRPGDAVYAASWLANASGSAKRQRWLERMQELGYFELPSGSAA